MRQSMIAALSTVFLLTAPSLHAAPTCEERNGQTVKCGTPTAMPVGWTPSPADIIDRPVDPGLSPAETVALIYILGAFFALLALMPEFDGSQEGDWDEQEGDRK